LREKFRVPKGKRDGVHSSEMGINGTKRAREKTAEKITE